MNIFNSKAGQGCKASIFLCDDHVGVDIVIVGNTSFLYSANVKSQSLHCRKTSFQLLRGELVRDGQIKMSAQPCHSKVLTVLQPQVTEREFRSLGCHVYFDTVFTK